MLPSVSPTEFMTWSWSQIEPSYANLAARELNAATVAEWLGDWSRLSDLIDEAYNRLYVATTVNTADEEASGRFNHFLDTIYPAAQAAAQRLKQKLLASGLTVPGFEIPLRNLRGEAELYREANLALLTEEQKLATSYEQIAGAQTVTWEDQEVTIQRLTPVYQNPDRTVRERAWRVGSERQLADRAAINALWEKLVHLRGQIAANAGLPSYRAYRWKQLHRFDYTPEDCARFYAAIEQVVVPVTARLLEKGRQRLGVDRLRPWDLTLPQGFGRVVDPPGLPALHPFDDVSELEAHGATMFQRVDPQFGAYFETMRREGLLDLGNRKHKAPGAYSIAFEATGRPFIFANVVGLHNDVQALLHEGGHSFHTFEMRALPYFQQRAENALPSEFAEVASMGMELLASPYLPAQMGGFYSAADAARARRELLTQMLFFWPYMAVVDGFQHWVYENAEAARAPANCDAQWRSLWRRFMVGVDWDGLEEVEATRWQRQLHIHTSPFYYFEYGIAQLGAVQVWRNALSDQAGAVARYRRALALGGTATLPELYKAAGAKFAFDAETLGEAVELMERTIAESD